MNCLKCVVTLAFAAVVASACKGAAQGAPPAAAQQTVPAPATKLEGFKPAEGSVVTLGYDEMGAVYGVSVDVRELRDAKGSSVRGLLVEVTESEYRKERAFVDADEIAELLKGLDAILAVTANPTKFKQFEVRYTTRGALQLVAFNDANDHISYAVSAGRITKAQRFLTTPAMQQFRSYLAAAQVKLVGPSAGLRGPQ